MTVDELLKRAHQLVDALRAERARSKRLSGLICHLPGARDIAPGHGHQVVPVW
jgi:hypothetical protein